MEDVDEIEAALDANIQDDVKYSIRRRLRWSVLDVLVRQHPNLPHSITVDFNRAFVTMDNPEYAEFREIHDPDELILIARMALDAWEQMVRLKDAAAKLEQAG